MPPALIDCDKRVAKGAELVNGLIGFVFCFLKCFSPTYSLVQRVNKMNVIHLKYHKELKYQIETCYQRLQYQKLAVDCNTYNAFALANLLLFI